MVASSGQEEQKLLLRKFTVISGTSHFTLEAVLFEVFDIEGAIGPNNTQYTPMELKYRTLCDWTSEPLLYILNRRSVPRKEKKKEGKGRGTEIL
ncbi:hypothetical protein U1Q18_044093 [Sarracenia purpurea var. burkii]